MNACDCKSYNGGPCYNCINGAHHICDNGSRVCPGGSGEGEERLKKVQQRLIDAGVRNVNFFWGPKAHTLSRDELCANVAKMLESYLDGKFEVIKVYSPHPRISIVHDPRWAGWWKCGRNSDRPHHFGMGTTPYMAWVDWKTRGIRE